MLYVGEGMEDVDCPCNLDSVHRVLRSEVDLYPYDTNFSDLPNLDEGAIDHSLQSSLEEDKGGMKSQVNEHLQFQYLLKKQVNAFQGGFSFLNFYASGKIPKNYVNITLPRPEECQIMENLKQKAQTALIQAYMKNE